MFKALIVQSLYNLSDDQLEYQIVDRASFKRFLGLKKSDKAPDSIEKGYRNKPLTEEQIANNKEKSRTRVRVKHVFGFVENSMHGSIVRTIGIARAKAKTGMIHPVK